MNKPHTRHPFVLLLFTCTILLSSFILIISPPPGLTNAEAIGPFINNNLPNQAPAGNIELVPTYSNIQWLSPIVALPFPGTNNMLVVEMDG